MNNKIALAEEPYLSINGEGLHIGKPVIFIRTQGCNVGCSWCDSKYTWKKGDKNHEWSYKQLADALQKIGYQYAQWWTGGEPLEHWDEIKGFIDSEVYPSMAEHLNTDVLISAVPKYIDRLNVYMDHLVVDVKLKSANIQYNQFEIIDKYIEDTKHNQAFTMELKMVVDANPSVRDNEIDEAIKVIERFPNTRITLQPLYWDEIQYDKTEKTYGFSSEFKQLASEPAGLKLSDWYDIIMPKLENNPDVYLLPQLHKMIWPGIQAGI